MINEVLPLQDAQNSLNKKISEKEAYYENQKSEWLAKTINEINNSIKELTERGIQRLFLNTVHTWNANDKYIDFTNSCCKYSWAYTYEQQKQLLNEIAQKYNDAGYKIITKQPSMLLNKNKFVETCSAETFNIEEGIYDITFFRVGISWEE